MKSRVMLSALLASTPDERTPEDHHRISEHLHRLARLSTVPPAVLLEIAAQITLISTEPGCIVDGVQQGASPPSKRYDLMYVQVQL